MLLPHLFTTYFGFPKTQLTCLQHIQNSVARAVVAAPRSSDPDQILKSLHSLKVQERTEYKIISTTYKVLQSSSPHYLRDIITIQPSRSTRSSSLVSLLHPQAQSSLKITNRSFRYAAPHLWNKLPHLFAFLVSGPPRSALLHCQAPTLLLIRWLACLTGSSILVLKLTFSPDPFPRNLPLSLTD